MWHKMVVSYRHQHEMAVQCTAFPATIPDTPNYLLHCYQKVLSCPAVLRHHIQVLYLQYLFRPKAFCIEDNTVLVMWTAPSLKYLCIILRAPNDSVR